MKALRSADDAVRAWWRLTQRDENVRALDPFAMIGRVPAKACACGNRSTRKRPAWVEGEAKRGGFVVRCRRCGTPWEFTLETVLKGRIQVSRQSAGAAHRSAIRRVDLERLIAQLPDPDSWVYGLYLWTDLGYERVAERANELVDDHPATFTAPGGAWTPKRVRTAVARARRLLEKLLEEAGLIPRALNVYRLSGEVVHLEGFEPLEEALYVPNDPARWAGIRTIEELAAQVVAPGLRCRLLHLGRNGDGRPCYRELRP